MGSANLVEVTYVEESTYNTKPTPLSGVTLNTVRFTSESLSGTPQTTESAELRVDRMSSGQVTVGLDVGGGIDFELSKDVQHDDFLRAAMMQSAWTAKLEFNTSVTLAPIDAQSATLTSTVELTGIVVGDMLRIRPDGTQNFEDFSVVITSIDTPDTVLTVATPRDQPALTTEASVVTRPDYVEIGSTQVSFVLAKAYTDILHEASLPDEHSQTYTGSLVSGFTVNASYGEIVSGDYQFLGAGYFQEAPSFSQQVETAGGTVAPAGTTNPLNASVDMVLVTVNEGAGYVATDYCLENLVITLDNGLDPRNCIGKVEPTGYTLGTAAISITADIYLSDSAYDTFLPAKLTQTPIGLFYEAVNSSGGYAFDLRAVQLSFADPASEGQNEQTMINGEGTAKVGDGGASALRIYRIGA
jgi:hypothetical protein